MYSSECVSNKTVSRTTTEWLIIVYNWIIGSDYDVVTCFFHSFEVDFILSYDPTIISKMCIKFKTLLEIDIGYHKK